MIKKLPKTPKKDFLKNIKGLGTDILNHKIKCTEELGDTFKMDLGYVDLILSSNPEFIKHVLQANQKNYKKSYAYEALKMGLGNGLVTSEGDYWRKQRRLAQPVFYKKNLENLFEDMGRTTLDFLNKLELERGKTIDISKEMMKLTATIVLRALFHLEETDKLDSVYHAMNIMQEYIMKHVRNPIIRPFLKLGKAHRIFKKELKEMDALVYEMMEERKKSSEKKSDLLQMLMDVEDADTGEKMTDLQLRDELITIFSAGHETSASALSFTLYLLAQYPEVVAKLREEIDSVIPEGRLPSFEDLKQLQYTHQVISEGMRMFPPAWVVGRAALEDDVINGYEVKKDINVLLEIYIMHHSPKYWKNPEHFDPERFSPEKVKNRPKHHYIPFGAGPRMCIGNHFAMMEMQLILAAIIQKFDFEIDPTHQIKFDALITLRPKNGILLKVR